MHHKHSISDILDRLTLAELVDYALASKTEKRKLAKTLGIPPRLRRFFEGTLFIRMKYPNMSTRRVELERWRRKQNAAA